MVEPDTDGPVEKIKVGVITHSHPNTPTSLVVSLLRSLDNVEVVLIEDKDILLVEEGVPAQLRDILDKFPQSSLYAQEMISPYAGMGRRGKGEKKRDRAWQRRLCGKGNSF